MIQFLFQIIISLLHVAFQNKVKDENSCLQGEVVALHDKNDELLIELENMKQKYLTLLEDKNESSSGFQKNQVPQQMDHDTFVKYVQLCRHEIVSQTYYHLFIFMFKIIVFVILFRLIFSVNNEIYIFTII